MEYEGITPDLQVFALSGEDTALGEVHPLDLDIRELVNPEPLLNGIVEFL